jgi:ElaB/YqjD/DUF883 family membrane-anchored ribosome-binding protein
MFFQPLLKAAIMTDANRDKLLADVKTLMTDADDIVKAMASTTGEKAAEMADKLRGKLRSAKEKMGDAQAIIADKTDDYVHDNPWQAVGVAAGVGFLLGLLISRR